MGRFLLYPSAWSVIRHNVVCRCVLTTYLPAVYTFYVTWHMLYRGLKEKGLESLMVLNAVMLEVPLKHVGMR